MKRTLLDQIIGYFNPKAELRRLSYRRNVEIVRAYDSASNFLYGDWLPSRGTSAITEVRGGQSVTRDRSRDLVRNSPYANKGVNVIVSNTIGAGIVPKIKGRNKTQIQRITKEWKAWAESTACDYDGLHNFYGLQWLAMRSTVEGGEVLGRKSFKNQMAKIQLMESDYINRNLSNAKDNIEGIWINPNSGEIVGYELYDKHPGDYRGFDLKSSKIPAEQIIHVFKQERVGQMRGMPWLYSVATALKDFADYQNATLVRQKVAACTVAFITEKESDRFLDPETLRAQREAENMLEPGSVRYLAAGQTVTMASPTGVDQYDPFARQTLRSVASGLGISYESLTGDYSQVNFSSGRMGHLEMQRNIDVWRWHMMIPMFCEPAFQHFLQWCAVRNIDVVGVSADWTCPAREMIDPTKEIASLKEEVRSGFKPLSEAIRERGLDPDAVIEEAAEFNAKLDALGLTFDSDPRKVNAAGALQSSPTAGSDGGQGEVGSGETNQTDGGDTSSSGRTEQSQSGE